MKLVIQEAIKQLASKAKLAENSITALQFSQAANNLANTLSAFDANKRAEEQRKLELEMLELT